MQEHIVKLCNIAVAAKFKGFKKQKTNRLPHVQNKNTQQHTHLKKKKRNIHANGK